MNRLILSIFFFNLLFHTALGNTPDSLENELRLTATDTAKVMVYNKYARNLLTLYRQNQCYQQALQYAQQGLALAEQISFTKGEAELHRTIGNAYFFLNDFEQAINHYNEVISIYTKSQILHDHNDMAQIYYNLGLVYRRQSRVFHAVDNIQKALSLWRQSKNSERMLLAYRSIIQAYQSVGDLQLAEKYAMEALILAKESENRYEEALMYEELAKLKNSSGNVDMVEEYFQKSMDIYAELDDQLSVARVINNIATNLYRNDMDKSLNSFRRSIEIFENLTPTNYQLFELYFNVAKLYRDNNQMDSAQFYYEKALNKAIISENQRTMAAAYDTVARFYMDKGDLNRAERDFQKAYEIALNSGLHNIRSNALSGLSSINFRRGNYKTAYEYLQRYQTINDSLISESNMRFIQQMTLQHEYEKDRLEEQELIRWQLERQSQTFRYHQIVMVIIIFAFILTAILLAVIIRSNRLKNQANRELNRYKDSLEEMVEIKTRESTIAKEKAEESNRLKSAFLANMSHEIRTPLNGIVGFLQFIDSHNISPDKRREYIEIINSCSKQLVKIIDDILDISKIEAQQMDIYPIQTKLNSLMKEMHTFFEIYIQNNNKRIELFLDDSNFIHPALIMVDTIRLKQIINNLLSNAVKFTEKGYIRFGYHLLEEKMLEFFVEDSGIGIPENQLELIFRQFHKVEQHANNRLYGGIGIGLSISFSLTQLMGGEISVKSIEGAGTTFSFTIPYIPCEAQLQ